MTQPTSPAPTHLDTRDPATPGGLGIREEIERELDAYPDAEDLVMLVPEDRWSELARQLGGEASADEATYRGVRLKKAAVSAVVVQDGF